MADLCALYALRAAVLTLHSGIRPRDVANLTIDLGSLATSKKRQHEEEMILAVFCLFFQDLHRFGVV